MNAASTFRRVRVIAVALAVTFLVNYGISLTAATAAENLPPNAPRPTLAQSAENLPPINSPKP